jgi:prepilin-type N-terminal cleavage/methylation domain-containing protein
VRLSSLRRRLGDQRGFTLIEMLMALTLSLAITGAALGVLRTTMKRTNETVMRVDANQRGRTALETVTRALRSQVCANGAAPVITATPTEILLYTDFTDNAAKVPDKRRIKLDTTAGELLEQVYAGSGTKTSPTWAGSPSTRSLLKPAAQTGSTPVFKYFSYASGATKPEVDLGGTVAAADLPRIARIDVAFTAKPSAGARGKVALADQVFVRSLDPNDPVTAIC